MNKIFTIALSSLVVAAIMTSIAFQIASATTTGTHTHSNSNKNSVHQHTSSVTNSGGSHTNGHCILNSNNDKGSVCHSNTH